MPIIILSIVTTFGKIKVLPGKLNECKLFVLDIFLIICKGLQSLKGCPWLICFQYY